MPTRVWWFSAGDGIDGGEFHRQAQDWVRSLGLDPANIRPDLEVLRDDEGRCTLLVEEYALDEDGNRQFDGNVDLLTAPRALHVEDGSWPSRPEVSV